MTHRLRAARHRIVLIALMAVVGLVIGGQGAAASIQTGDQPPSPGMRVLFITAHPDDETMFEMGRLQEAGWEVSIALVTNGENGKVVEGILPTPDATGDVLIEQLPGPGAWLTQPPDGPAIREIRTHVALARERRREFLASQTINGIARVFFLSGLRTSDFEDSWDNGVRNWDVPLLERRLRDVARTVDPDVIITLNPDETWAHPQHLGLGRIVQRMYRAGDFDQRGRPGPLLYGIREHGWYVESLVPQRGDESFDRLAYSSSLGMTYSEAWTRATSAYISQSSHPEWFAARVAAGVLPGYSSFDFIRRLDHRGGPGLKELLASAGRATAQRDGDRAWSVVLSLAP